MKKNNLFLYNVTINHNILKTNNYIFTVNYNKAIVNSWVATVNSCIFIVNTTGLGFGMSKVHNTDL